MITGKFTALRAIEPEDLPQLRAWRNNPEMRTYFREYKEISEQSQMDWYNNTVQNNPNVRMFSIIDKSTKRLMGACGLCYIDPVRRHADFSIYLGVDDLYIDDKFAPDAGHVLLTYGFEELNLNRVWAEIYEHDTAKQSLLPNLGFVQEGRLRNHHYTSGKYIDSLLYGVLKSEFK